MEKMRRLRQIPVIILKTRTGYSAHSPVVDGCVVTGKTIDKTLHSFKEAVEFHLEGEQLVKHRFKVPVKVLKETFSDYGTEAFYATIEIPAAWSPLENHF
jgi:predicted RNase H-like HicB family nuclease